MCFDPQNNGVQVYTAQGGNWSYATQQQPDPARVEALRLAVGSRPKAAAEAVVAQAEKYYKFLKGD